MLFVAIFTYYVVHGNMYTVSNMLTVPEIYVSFFRIPEDISHFLKSSVKYTPFLSPSPVLPSMSVLQLLPYLLSLK